MNLKNSPKIKYVIAAALCMVTSPALAAIDSDSDALNIKNAGDAISNAIANTTLAAQKINSETESILYQRIGDLADRFTNLSTAQYQQAVQLSKQKITSFRDALVQQGIAQEQLQSERVYGKLGIDGCCGYEDIAQKNGAGRAAQSARVTAFGRDAETRSRSGSPTKGGYHKVKDLLTIQDADFTIQTLYPPQLTFTANDLKTVATINQQIIDPLPPNKISSAVKNSPAGENYESMRLTYEKTKEAPRQAQHVITSAKAPDYEISEWAKSAWAEMGNTSGTPEGTVGGKMSQLAILELFVKSRMDNPKWYQKVTGAGEGGEGGNDVWQLRQINLNTAMLMQMEYREMRLMEHAVELMAQQRSNDIDDKYIKQLQTLLERAESQQ